jgi:hypothetical protein
VTDEIGLNPPERRGDRYWMLYGEGGEAVDFKAVTADLLDLLESAFGLPNGEVGAEWQVLPG